MAADGQVVFEISADNRELKSALREATETIERTSKNWDKAASGATDGIVDSFQDATNAIESESKKWDRAAAKAAENIEDSFDEAADTIESSVKETTDAVESQTKKTEGAFKSMLKGMIAAFSAAKITQFIFGFSKDAINLASDLEEVQNVVDVTFGEGATQIETWAKAAGTQFGLTETQAKRFTSTLGAMRKSAGIAGPEIVNMSTDLAGLAADMASFYNMDFDTAFDKIRSGLTGQTEPLRALGINMSVANLEAFALEQGITKAFSAMSQGEQTMLRYQYLMQATADAQGDFARTSDGYANATRTLQTNLDSLKTSVGNVLLPIINKTVNGINSLFAATNGTTQRTVLDDLADIDIETDRKLAEIDATATAARDLIEILDEMIATDASGVLEALANGANKLQSNIPQRWDELLGALQGAGTLEGLETAGGGLEALADALNGASLDTDRAEAWKTLLSTLGENADALSELTGTSAEETRDWLATLAEGANALDPNSAEGWGQLYKSLVHGMPGLEGTDLGAGVFRALTGEGATAEDYLRTLGYETDNMADKTGAWLAVCQKLVQTLPGLSSIIDTQTGEVKGGTTAIAEYVSAWQDLENSRALLNAAQQRYAAITADHDVYGLQIEAAMAVKAAERAAAEFDALGVSRAEGALALQSGWSLFESAQGREVREKYKAFLDAQDAADKATRRWINAANAEKERLAQLDDVIADIEEQQSKLNDAVAAGETAMTALELAATGDEAAISALSETLQAATDAFSDLEKYTSSVYDSVARSLESAVGGFDKIVTPAEKARSEMQALNAEMLNADAQRLEGLQKTFSDLNSSIPTIENMTAALEDQLKYLTDYQDAMDAARMAGISDEILASLSDGSVQSYDYLVALADATEDQAEKINTAYADVATARDDLSETLTAQRLAADDEFTALLAAANDAVDGLDLYADAEAAMSNTVQGIADGIAAKIPEVQAQVSNLLAALSSLNNIGFGEIAGSINYGGFSRVLSGSRGPKSTFTPHANGLDYVPFDNYLAALHEGESILTAEEARVWRDFKYSAQSSANNIDYEALGGVMRENVGRGNVYLDGQTVGRVISGQQANSYRALERSGWQG